MSKFATGATDILEDSEETKGEPDVPAVLKEAEQKEQNKEESNNQQCGTGRRSKFASAATDIIEEE